MTILLSARDIDAVLDLADAFDVLRQGFHARGTDAIEPQRRRTELPGPGTATVLFPGLIDGVPAYTVKINTKFPGSDPALRGVVALHGVGSGELLALLDSASVTASCRGRPARRAP